MDTQKAKQPKALLPLCATEAWERFGFYMIQTALILMLTNHFQFPDDKAYSLLEPLVRSFISPQQLAVILQIAF